MCEIEQIALLLLWAILVQNVTVRRTMEVLWFPTGSAYHLDREIKDFVTVVAMTTPY